MIHVNHEKRVAWVSISKHGCDPVPIVMGLRLAALWAARALLLCSRTVLNPRFASFLEWVVPNSPQQIIFSHFTLL